MYHIQEYMELTPIWLLLKSMQNLSPRVFFLLYLPISTGGHLLYKILWLLSHIDDKLSVFNSFPFQRFFCYIKS